MINIAHTKANNPSVRIGSMILRTVQESCLYIDATPEKWYIGTPKLGTFDIGAPSAPNEALNGALN